MWRDRDLIIGFIIGACVVFFLTYDINWAVLGSAIAGIIAGMVRT